MIIHSITSISAEIGRLNQQLADDRNPYYIRQELEAERNKLIKQRQKMFTKQTVKN